MIYKILIIIILVLSLLIIYFNQNKKISESFSIGFITAKKEVNKLMENKKKILKDINKIKKYIEAGFNVIKKVKKIENLKKSINNLINQTLNQIKKIKELKDIFKNAFNNLTKEIPGMTDFKNNLMNIKTGFDFIKKGFTMNEQEWKDKLDNLKKQVEKLWEKINFLNNLNNTGDIILGGLTEVGNAVASISNEVGQYFVGLSNTIIKSEVGSMTISSGRKVGKFGENSFNSVANWGAGIANNLGNVASAFFGRRNKPCSLACYSPFIYKDFRGNKRIFRIYKVHRKHDGSCNYPNDMRNEEDGDNHIRTVFHNGCKAQIEILYLK